MSLLPGTCLASSEVVALIGSGGMGEVYKAPTPWTVRLTGTLTLWRLRRKMPAIRP